MVCAATAIKPSMCTPKSIFITAMDTNPHAPSIEVALQGREEDFAAGAEALSKLSGGRTYLCRSPFTQVGQGIAGLTIEEFKPQSTTMPPVCRAAPMSRRMMSQTSSGVLPMTSMLMYVGGLSCRASWPEAIDSSTPACSLRASSAM